MKIGFFDSGIGGLTVLHEAMMAYPQAHYLYFADTVHVPYGTKSKKTIKRLVIDAIDFLKDQDIDLLVVACNTATSVCIKELRARFDFPIIGMEPAIKPAAQVDKASQKRSRIMVSATRLTLKEKKLHDLIANLNITDKTDLLSFQKLVTFAEDAQLNSPKLHKYLSKKLDKIDWGNYSSLVLGCTHFLYFKKQIALHLPAHVQLLDGNNGTVNRLLYFIKKENLEDRTCQKITTKLKKQTKKKVTFYKSKKKIKSKHFKLYLDFLGNGEGKM